MAKKVKSVSFNDDLPEEKELLNYISRRNFSKYVKRLVKLDMEAKAKAKLNATNTKKEPEEVPVLVKKNRFENFYK